MALALLQYLLYNGHNSTKGGRFLHEKETDPAKIMEAAYALKSGANLGYEVTLEGKVKSIDVFYDASFDNISVWITVAGKDLLCYRMKGEGAENLKVGDTITVSGKIKRYVDTSKDRDIVEFDTGCTFVKK